MRPRRAIDPDRLSAREGYLLLTSAVIPRPIAFTSTVSEHGVANLAPFSFFNGVSSQPPIVSLAIGLRRGQEKDTLRNLRATGELVINAATEALAEAVNLASGDWPPEVSEIERCGLTAEPSVRVRPPRVAESPVALECQVVELVERPGGAPVTLVLARVLLYHVDPAVLSAAGTVDAQALRPLARLGGSEYGRVREVFSLERPRVD